MAEQDNTQNNTQDNIQDDTLNNITESDAFKEVTKYLDSHMGDYLRLTKEITEMSNRPFDITVNYGHMGKDNILAGQIGINVPKNTPEDKTWTPFIISLKPILSSAITLIRKYHPDINNEQLTNFIIGQCIDIVKNTIKDNIQIHE